MLRNYCNYSSSFQTKYINLQYNPKELSFVHIGTSVKIPSREKSGSSIHNSQTAISTSAYCWIGPEQQGD
jgi:hypothetical protein